MQSDKSRWGRWVVAVLALVALALVFVNLVIDNTSKGAVQKVDGYVPWEEATVEAVESLPLQDGGGSSLSRLMQPSRCSACTGRGP